MTTRRLDSCSFRRLVEVSILTDRTPPLQPHTHEAEMTIKHGGRPNMSFADVQKCGARSRIGGSCQQPGMANGRCRLHGGKTPSGVASPNLVHGRFSKDLPTRLLARFEEALSDR